MNHGEVIDMWHKALGSGWRKDGFWGELKRFYKHPGRNKDDLHYLMSGPRILPDLYRINMETGAVDWVEVADKNRLESKINRLYDLFFAMDCADEGWMCGWIVFVENPMIMAPYDIWGAYHGYTGKCEIVAEMMDICGREPREPFFLTTRKNLL